MISVVSVKIGDETCMGVKVQLPDSPPLVAVIAKKGFLMCGFLNVNVAERLGVVAASVTGVENFGDMLQAQVKEATSGARTLGVNIGMKGSSALKCFCQHIHPQSEAKALSDTGK